jgi:DHA2 family multidrug resistance protein-like MFS transporter
MATGLTVLAAAFALLTPASVSTTYPQLVLVLVLIGAGMALASAPATANIITSVPPDKAGVGSAMDSAAIDLGGAVGIAAGGSLVAVIYGATIDLTSFGLSPEAVHTAGESIGGALGVADGIGGSTAAQIVLVAREAFTTAFAWTMGVFAVIAIVSGLATWWSMGGHESGRSTEPTG